MEPGELHRKTCQRWNVPWGAHELTFSCYQRRAFLSKDRTRQFLADAVNRARARLGFHVWAYVIMPEHVHLLILPAKEVYSISDALKAVKQSVSRRAVGWLKANNPPGLRWVATGRPDKPYQFWQDGGGFDRNIHNFRQLGNAFSYIHNNPVKRGLVARPEDWAWSSAQDWADVRVGPIPIDKETCLNSMV